MHDDRTTHCPLGHFGCWYVHSGSVAGPARPWGGPSTDQLRAWTDSTGKHTIQAEFVEFKEGKVRLRKQNGKVVTIPIEKLSDADRELVQRQSKGKPAAKNAPKEFVVDLGSGIKLEMVLIPAGEFMMGSPDSDKDAMDEEKPQHRVRITKPFYLGKYLVTQEQWEAVMGNNPSNFKGPKNPVENGQLGRLPAVSDKLNAKSRPRGGKFHCPPRRSGNTLAGRGAKRGIALATTSRSSAIMPGMTRTRARRRILLARRSRMPGGCTICTGTYGSGVRIGMVVITMRTHRRTIRRGRSRVRAASSGAGAGSIAPGCAVRPVAMSPGMGPRSWACVSAWFRRTSRARKPRHCKPHPRILVLRPASCRWQSCRCRWQLETPARNAPARDCPLR